MLDTLRLFAIDYSPVPDPTGTTDAWFSGGTGVWTSLVSLAVFILMIAATWRIFTKAGRPGWAAIVPIYNSLQLIWTAGKPWWWIILFFIPFVNIVVAAVLYYNLAKAFGKGVGYALLIFFLPFIGFPLLAWGGAKYKLKKPANKR